jgi:hypothetical protein
MAGWAGGGRGVGSWRAKGAAEQGEIGTGGRGCVVAGHPDEDQSRRFESAASPAVGALQQATRSVPIVFVTVVDPVGAGIVPNLARPGGNTTGFTLFEHAVSGKWLELLKEIAPGVTRVSVIRDPNRAPVGRRS